MRLPTQICLFLLGPPTGSPKSLQGPCSSSPQLLSDRLLQFQVQLRHRERPHRSGSGVLPMVGPAQAWHLLYTRVGFPSTPSWPCISDPASKWCFLFGQSFLPLSQVPYSWLVPCFSILYEDMPRSETWESCLCTLAVHLQWPQSLCHIPTPAESAGF